MPEGARCVEDGRRRKVGSAVPSASKWQASDEDDGGPRIFASTVARRARRADAISVRSPTRTPGAAVDVTRVEYTARDGRRRKLRAPRRIARDDRAADDRLRSRAPTQARRRDRIPSWAMGRDRWRRDDRDGVDLLAWPQRIEDPVHVPRHALPAVARRTTTTATIRERRSEKGVARAMRERPPKNCALATGACPQSARQ